MNIWIILLSGCFICWPVLAEQSVADLSSYKKTNKIWLSTEQIEIKLKKFQIVSSNEKGSVKLLRTKSGLIKKGDKWAEIEIEEFDSDKKTLELEIASLEEEGDDLEGKIIKYKAEKTKYYNELVKKIFTLETVKNNLEFSKEVRNKVSTELTALKNQKESVAKKMTKEHLDNQRERNEEEWALKLKKTKRQLKKLKSRSELLAPFTGVFELRLSAVKDDTSGLIEVELGDELASFSDESEVEIMVSPMSANAYFIEVKQIKIELFPNNIDHKITACFSHRNIKDKRQNWIFKVKQKDVKKAKNLIGDKRTGHLYYYFEKEVTLIPKSAIASKNPDILEKQGWVVLVQHLWPEAKVLHVGPRSIAVEQE